MTRADHDTALTTEPPYGAAVVVYRRAGAGVEFLLLQRSPRDPAFAAAWAWGPPSGGRHPAKPLDRCAARELCEETVLRLPVRPTGAAALEWTVYRAEAPRGAGVAFAAEHDEYRWLPLAQALALATPAAVRAGRTRGGATMAKRGEPRSGSAAERRALHRAPVPDTRRARGGVGSLAGRGGRLRGVGVAALCHGVARRLGRRTGGVNSDVVERPY